MPPHSGGPDTVVICFTNPRARGLNNAHRVENEVATQDVFRQRLLELHPDRAHIVPAIYAWEPCRHQEVPNETGFGWWMMCEFMPGTNLDAQFAKMELPERLAVLEQVADIFAAFQRTPIPDKISAGYLGSLTFNGSGQMVGGQMSILSPGPWQNYIDL